MALTPETSTALIPLFQGSNQAEDTYNVDPGHGFLSINNDFVLGGASSSGVPVQAQTRRGVSQVVQTPSSTGSFFRMGSWYFSFSGSPNSYVACLTNAGVKFYNQSTGTWSGLFPFSAGAVTASFVFDGIRCYFAFADLTGINGVAAAKIYGLYANNSFANPAYDSLFAAPLQTSIVTVATLVTSSGVITQGTHNWGYVFTTRNGYTGALNPVNSSGVFAPASFTQADSVHNIEFSLDFLSIPSYLSPTDAPVTPVVQIVMTTAANPNQYYLVPGATADVPSSPGTVNIVVSISDGTLAATAADVTEMQNLLTQDQSGNGPFTPWALFLYSSRMAYCTLDASGQPVVYFSDQNNYQSLNAAYYGIYLEGRQIPVQGCSIGGVCYIATLSALYATQDNGGLPGTWTPPARVDGSVGVLSPTCLLAVGGKILLASEKGLYIYRGGPFPTIPVSYWQAPDWNRINWSQPTQVQVVDDAFDRVIRVAAPLNVVVTGATNTNPISITTAVMVNGTPVAYPHLFQTGLVVTISGVGGNTAANVSDQNITVTGPNTFTIPIDGTSSGTYTSGGVASPQVANAIMCWNYSVGDAPGQAFYSLHAFSAYLMTSMATVRNLTTNQDETWFGPGAYPGNLIRRVLPTDPLVYRDVDLSNNPTAIYCPYGTSYVPNSQDESMTLHDFTGAHFRVSGNGSLNIAVYGLDGTQEVIPLASPLTLSRTPGMEILVKWFYRSEQQSIMFWTNAVDAYFVMALIRAYYTNSLPMR